MKLILASSSPRRRELLTSVGLQFDVIPSRVEEKRREGEAVDRYVVRLAEEKAVDVASLDPDAWVIGADTVVQLGARTLEKPRDPAEAVSMLGALAGREHTVYTGVSIVRLASGWKETTITKSLVRMVVLDRADIDWYVSTGEPLDKAGAYAVQGVGGWFIESIRGSYTNVVGLPMSTLFAMMRRAGLDPLREADLATVQH